ncbi:hypothetical protein PVK06_035365 [Gossypium arboreum]|uniref:Uncharacterized protein n=1 Tax=Gossypium arboreum TaxID=29729 RepID=A0ABR0NGM6_GOSAR|nr:hypothetical protein PVK06_035365 [Gossypium arboreum]
MELDLALLKDIPAVITNSTIQLTNMKYDGSRGTQEHIIEMTNIAARLKTLG